MEKKNRVLKILVIGDSGVGKTSMLQSYINGKIDKSVKPTIGADFLKKKLTIDDTEVTL